MFNIKLALSKIAVFLSAVMFGVSYVNANPGDCLIKFGVNGNDRCSVCKTTFEEARLKLCHREIHSGSHSFLIHRSFLVLYGEFGNFCFVDLADVNTNNYYCFDCINRLRRIKNYYCDNRIINFANYIINSNKLIYKDYYCPLCECKVSMNLKDVLGELLFADKFSGANIVFSRSMDWMGDRKYIINLEMVK